MEQKTRKEEENHMKKTYRIRHTDKSGLMNFESFPIIGEEGIKNYLDYIEWKYGKRARENAKVMPF